MNAPQTALVVDDEDQLLRLIARVIERSGGRVLTAESGPAAREVFAAHRDEIGIILLDVTMPGGDGAEKLMPEFLAERPDLRVIITSGDLLPPNLEAELSRVGGEFLKKPFVPKTLVRMLEGVGESAASPTSPTASATPGIS